MHSSKTIGLSLLVASLAFGSAAIAQSAHESHHPDDKGVSSTQSSEMPSGSMKGKGRMMGGGMMGGGMMGRKMQGGMMGSGCPMMGMAMAEDGTPHTAGRIAFLKAELAITDAQEAAFDSYAAALRKNLESMHTMRSEMKNR